MKACAFREISAGRLLLVSLQEMVEIYGLEAVRRGIEQELRRMEEDHRGRPAAAVDSPPIPSPLAGEGGGEGDRGGA